MNTKKFWLDTLERVGKTFVQAFCASIIVLGVDDWEQSLGASVIAGAIAVATSLAGSRVGNPDSASVLPASEEP